MFHDWGIYTPWAVFIATVCPSLSTITDKCTTNKVDEQLASWAYISGSTADVSYRYSTNTVQSYDNCLAVLDYLLSSNARVEPRDGLGDLIAQGAGLLESDRGRGGPMEQEMSTLLWRLIRNDKGEGKKRKESSY